MYAGLRPGAAFASLVSIEGFGLPRTQPEQAPARVRRWLDELREAPALRALSSSHALRAVPAEAQPAADRRSGPSSSRMPGRPERRTAACRMRADPTTQARRIPILYRREEAEACWRAIRAPLLFVVGGGFAITPGATRMTPRSTECVSSYSASRRHGRERGTHGAPRAARGRCRGDRAVHGLARPDSPRATLNPRPVASAARAPVGWRAHL